MIDIVLVLLLAGYAISGFRQGLVVGLASLGGFVLGAVVGIVALPALASDLVSPGARRAIAVLLGVVVLAWVGQLVGALFGERLRGSIDFAPARLLDQAVGAVLGVVSVALVMWFVAGAVRGGPSPALSRAVASSKVIKTIDAVAPSQLDSVAQTFRDVVADTSFPRVFAGVGPEDIVPVSPPDAAVLNQTMLDRAQRSIVKITGEAEACGRGQEGSGSVVASGRVVTNAHVVAGVTNPRVQVGGSGRRYDATVVAFDPRRDVAVLAVPGLKAPVLPTGTDLARGADAVVVGFPNDGPYTASAARVRQILRAAGEDIYGGSGAVREVYSLYATVEPGNSGGPVLSPDGKLVGVVFAKSLDDSSTGYALTLKESEPVIQAGINASSAVSTGGCAAG